MMYRWSKEGKTIAAYELRRAGHLIVGGGTRLNLWGYRNAFSKLLTSPNCVKLRKKFRV